MPPKVRYNDKARAGGLAKAQAIRDARKHGRKLPQGEAPKSKKQKRIDKYIDSKLRNDEKVRLIKKLSEQPKVEGLSSTKVMKRTKGQDKKQQFDTFAGFKDDDDDDDDDDESDDSESYLKDEPDVVETIDNNVQNDTTSFSSAPSIPAKRSAGAFGFVPSCEEEPLPKKPKKASLKYNWRAKLEQEKKRKAGIISESESEDNADDSSTSESADDSDIADEDKHEIKLEEKRTSFKNWAAEQTGSTVANLDISAPVVLAPETYVPRPRSKSPEAIDTADLKPPTLIPVLIERRPEIEASRADLPAYAYEQELVEKIKSHSTVIVSGATGSGKTTQIPQFLYEAGFKGIGVTQPRRVAAVSMARRVASELGSEGTKVGYQIRFDSNVKSGTQIKFMTDGVLLREVALDFMLSKYEVLIIDEAHERSINTDILIGILSRVIRLRKDTATPLRLVIMSATLRVSDFSENKRLFAVPPPIMSIEARQYPVTVHFSKRTEMSSYVEEAFKKVCKIHEKLPPGGVLVFLTGQQEIQQCTKLLKERFQKCVLASADGPTAQVKIRAQDQVVETEDYEATADGTRSAVRGSEDVVDDYDGDSDSDLSEIEETEHDKAMSQDLKEQKYVQILPLYSLLPTTEQMKVFTAPPPQCRQIILATNVAETSLTIPGIRYVIDSGRAKIRRFNGKVQSFEIDWISKASADQRSGRAGRTGPGHAYRLFSSAVYDTAFPLFSEAEILNTPIDGVVLQMKSMNIHTITNFPFPTPPDRPALATAEKLLTILGALDKDGKITELGTQMSLFPLTPRFAKMIVVGNQGGLLPYAIALVAGMSVDDPFLRQEILHEDYEDGVDKQVDEERKRKRQAYFRVMNQFSNLDPSSDAMRLLMAVCAFNYAKDEEEFCRDHFLRSKAMNEIKKLRMQISNVIKSLTTIDLSTQLRLKPLATDQIELLHKLLAAAFLDQICIRADLVNKEPLQKGNILRIPYIPLSPLEHGQEAAYIHPSSHNIKNTPASSPPEYLLYSSLSASPNDPDKIRIKVLAPIKASWIAEIAHGSVLLKYGKPLISNLAHIEFLDDRKTRRLVPVIPTFQMNGSGRQGWNLPAVKITQKLVGTRWVNEE